MIRLKRVYEDPVEEDGRRMLVDRIWPRGVSKEAADLDEWMKEIAPSDELRKWFGHETERWEEFVERYRRELQQPERRELLDRLGEWCREGTVTLLFGAKDTEHNQAVVLAGVLEEQYDCEAEAE